MTPIPTNQDFATEVRSDRLNILWRYTLVIAFIVFWLAAVVGTLQKTIVAPWLIACACASVGCLLTRFLLQKNHFAQSVWSYALGMLATVSIILMAEDKAAGELIPFLFPLIVFMIGLLLPPSSTFLFSILAALAVVFAPFINTGGPVLGWHQLFAIVLTFFSAILAAQVTGELYQITEWALLNYQRERKTTDDLFDNRQQLERALTRSQALSQELQDTNVQLESAHRTAEDAKHFRGQFLANMSHELRTPLNAIIGFSETMLKFPAMYDGITLPKAYESDLNQIYNSGRQLLGLINDILDLSKVDAGKLEIRMQRVELGPLLDAAQATATGLLGAKPIRLEKDLPDVLPDVWADETRLRQVMVNLYSNAVKFTDSGTITLMLRSLDEGIRISVKDTGVGIDSQFHEVIFEEFRQAGSDGRDPRSGSGLGLTISRQLLNLMGGRIWVESERGKGSIFHVMVSPYIDDRSRPKRMDLPAVSEPAEKQPEAEAEKVV